MFRNLVYEREFIATNDDNKKSSGQGIVLILLLVIVGVTLLWYFLHKVR